MKMFEFTGLKILHKDMMKKGEERVTFPFDFFEVLNKRIPEKFTMRPNYKDTLKIASKRREIEEETKIYFCGWRRNAKGTNVREKNLEKTRSAFGNAKAEMCKRKNISSCWTDRACEEELKKLNDIITM